MTNIAKNLKALRNKNGYSQVYVAAVTGITRSSYSGYENKVAEPNLCTALKLAGFYGVSIEDLIK